MKTEDEAKQCWCPFTAGPGMPMRGEAEPGDIFPDCRCIASACMAWRWQSIDDDGKPYILHEDGRPRGFCGLAGKP